MEFRKRQLSLIYLIIVIYFTVELLIYSHSLKEEDALHLALDKNVGSLLSHWNFHFLT